MKGRLFFVMSNIKFLDGDFSSLQRLDDEIRTIGERIGGFERNLEILYEEKAKTKQVMLELQGFE